MCVTGDVCQCVGGVPDLAVDGGTAADMTIAVEPTDLAGVDDLAASAGDLATGGDLGGGATGDLASALDLGRGGDLAGDLGSAASDLGTVGVLCGTGRCPAGNVCCLDGSSMAGTCVANVAACTASPFSCDSRETCPGAQKCCVTVDSVSSSLSGRASCNATCPDGAYSVSGQMTHQVSMLCRTDADCAGYSGSVFGVPTAFDACCHSSGTTVVSL
jgi:hypothetical protein